MNGKLAHECVVFGTLMPRFSCRGVACAERQSETNFPKNTSKHTQRLDVYYTRRNTTPSCRGHRPCGSKRVVSQKYAGKMVVAIAHHLVGKNRQTDRWRRTPLEHTSTLAPAKQPPMQNATPVMHAHAREGRGEGGGRTQPHW